jgi:hypothetical protein
MLADAIQAGVGLVESAANLVPDSVPRPIAKGGVAVGGVLLAFWALQKVRRYTWGTVVPMSCNNKRPYTNETPHQVTCIVLDKWCEGMNGNMMHLCLGSFGRHLSCAYRYEVCVLQV